MSDPVELTEAETIAQLREQLAARDVVIAEKQTELENATSTFRTVLALKNRKIKDLEEEIRRLTLEKPKEVVTTNVGANVEEPSEQVAEVPRYTAAEEIEQQLAQNEEETAEEPRAVPQPVAPIGEEPVRNGPDLFAGEWLNVSSDNTEAYLKEIVYGMLTRNIAGRMRPVLTFEINENEWTMNMISMLSTQETRFRLGEEMEEEDYFGGKITSTYELVGPMLVQTSRGANGEPDFRIERTVEGNTLTIVAECNGVQCTRIYEKAA